MNQDEKDAIEQAANALQAAVMLSTRVRQRSGEQMDDTIQLEAAVERAAKALKRLHPNDR